jgi:hypothetical protein
MIPVSVRSAEVVSHLAGHVLLLVCYLAEPTKAAGYSLLLVSATLMCLRHLTREE